MVIRNPLLQSSKKRAVLHAPVVLEILEELVLEEECRIIAACDSKVLGSVTADARHRAKVCPKHEDLHIFL